jgi:internalin A
MRRTSGDPARRAANPSREADHRIDDFLHGRTRDVDLSGLGLYALPDRLREASQTTRLNLRGNQLATLPDWLEEFEQLELLNLQQNSFEVIPPVVLKLACLRALGLGLNPRLQLPESPGALTGLANVGLGELYLTAAPLFLRRLRQLTELDLRHNQLTSLPDWLQELRCLRRLDLQGNRIATLPACIRRLPELKFLDVADNPGLNLPPDLAQSDDAAKIIASCFRPRPATTAAERLNEFKLVLVGRGRAGKTTLVHKLVTDRFRRFQLTFGVKITEWQITVRRRNVRARVWDFGGQEIMHGTHRVFMTKASLYIVVVTGEGSTFHEDAAYWLSMVRSFAGDAPVIVLVHQWDVLRFDVDRERLRERYGSNIVFLRTDSRTGRGIAQLRILIRRLAATLPTMNESWPAEWRRIKDELPALRKKWLAFDDFRRFCRARGVPDERDQDDLADMLHDLGVMVSYRSDESLRAFGVLHPRWVTRGIYRILTARSLRNAGGELTIDTLPAVLSSKEYPPRFHQYLLTLMEAFRLCHPVNDWRGTYIIPELLKKDEPKLDSDFPASECLGFEYRYDGRIPHGLLPRFIVETYSYREPRLVWRTGIVLTDGTCRAWVRGDVQARAIDIRVSGGDRDGRREFLGVIRQVFDRIHSAYEKRPAEWISIAGGTAKVERSRLLAFERSGRSRISVEIGDEIRDLSVAKLLGDVDLPGGPLGQPRWDAGKANSSGAVRVFISYSHKDARFLKQLRSALAPYERGGRIEIWADPLLVPGEDWEEHIFANLNQADIVILLVSNHFLDSVYCIDKELTRALQRNAEEEIAVVPVAIRKSRVDQTPIGKLHLVQPGGRAVEEHRKAATAWFEVTKQLDRVIAEFAARVNDKSSPTAQ